MTYGCILCFIVSVLSRYSDTTSEMYSVSRLTCKSRCHSLLDPESKIEARPVLSRSGAQVYPTPFPSPVPGLNSTQPYTVVETTHQNQSSGEDLR
ncbi:hypothetical protein CMEL01_09081 [Colletotrichum melonis]|uniref:Uncharacterized protein n=1 Tax=Colletotrichum melonis TaxID=1209925 RepID=A0AAI9TWE3_9PEZI|nr:hypothetical protein CMEL01_09081 [Colletotrichum melonis]